MTARHRWLVALGASLAEARNRAGLTQAELAERLGVHRQTVYRWEIGAQPPDGYSLCRACSVLGVSVDDVAPAFD